MAHICDLPPEIFDKIADAAQDELSLSVGHHILEIAHNDQNMLIGHFAIDVEINKTFKYKFKFHTLMRDYFSKCDIAFYEWGKIPYFSTCSEAETSTLDDLFATLHDEENILCTHLYDEIFREPLEQCVNGKWTPWQLYNSNDFFCGFDGKQLNFANDAELNVALDSLNGSKKKVVQNFFKAFAQVMDCFMKNRQKFAETFCMDDDETSSVYTTDDSIEMDDNVVTNDLDAMDDDAMDDGEDSFS